MQMEKTAQAVIMDELFESDTKNETVEILDFIRNSSVPLTDDQVKGIFLLNEQGLHDIGHFVMNVRPKLTPVKFFFEMVNKLTLADRIKGSAKLSSIVKANANPANAMNQQGKGAGMNG